MSAAYQRLSYVRATELVSDSSVDVATPVPAAPASGIKSVVVPRDLPSAPVLARSFRALYDAHAAFVWRNLRRLGVSDRDLEDKVQEVFVVAHRRWERFEDRGHGPRAWLFQIVLRVASDARRHRRRHPVDPDGGVAEEQQAIEPPQAAAVARRQALDLLDRALAAVEMDRRAVVVLHEIEQMTAPEIAQTLEIPLNTVYSRLRVGRLELEREVLRLRGEETAR